MLVVTRISLGWTVQYKMAFAERCIKQMIGTWAAVYAKRAGEAICPYDFILMTYNFYGNSR